MASQFFCRNWSGATGTGLGAAARAARFRDFPIPGADFLPDRFGIISHKFTSSIAALDWSFLPAA